MHIEFEWEGAGTYYLIPAVVRSGEVWDRDPLHVTTTGDLAHLLDEITFWEETTFVDDDPIWREGGIIYKGPTQESDSYLLTGGPRL